MDFYNHFSSELNLQDRINLTKWIMLYHRRMISRTKFILQFQVLSPAGELLGYCRTDFTYQPPYAMTVRDATDKKIMRISTGGWRLFKVKTKTSLSAPWQMETQFITTIPCLLSTDNWRPRRTGGQHCGSSAEALLCLFQPRHETRLETSSDRSSHCWGSCLESQINVFYFIPDIIFFCQP